MSLLIFFFSSISNCFLLSFQKTVVRKNKTGDCEVRCCHQLLTWSFTAVCGFYPQENDCFLVSLPKYTFYLNGTSY